MDVQNDKIKDLFSSKLSNFEPEVPSSVWGGLDQLLSNQAAPAPDSANSSTPDATSAKSNASILKTAGIIVGLAAAIVLGILLLPEQKEMIVDQNENVATEKVNALLEVVSADTSLLADIPLQPLQPYRTITARKEDAPQPLIIEKEEEKTEEKEFEPESEPKEIRLPYAKEESSPLVYGENKVLTLPKYSSHKKIAVGIKANANLFSRNITHTGGDLLFSKDIRSAEMRELLRNENKEFKLEHSQPISFGITVSKQLTSRLSLETGLVYTRLSSKVTSNSMFNLDETQKFDYLGVPLSLNYTFYELGRTKFYLSAGGMIQKDISGKLVSNMNFSIADLQNADINSEIFYSEPYYINNSIEQSRPQFSVFASLGVAYPIYRNLYLYGTVGGAYYFDAGNQYRTIFSDRKTQLDLNLGVKFDF